LGRNLADKKKKELNLTGTYVFAEGQEKIKIVILLYVIF